MYEELYEMKRLVFVVLVLLGVLGVSMPTFAQDAAGWTCPEGFAGQTLSVYNWSTYVAEDTVSNFETLCGVTVTYDVYASNEELFARLREGNPGYDIVVPTDYMVQVMAEEGMLQKLDKSKIPNFANLSPDLLGTPFDPNNDYSVPYQWGTIGIGYNTEVITTEVTGWEDLLNYEGNVAWLEDLRQMINIGLIMLGEKPNTDDPAKVAAARDYLTQHGSNVVAIAQDDGQAMLQRGDADMVIEYSGDIFQIMAEEGGEKFAYVIPQEGASLWTDNLAIAADAPNPELANVFIDYINDPQVSADIANYTAYGTPNQASIDQGLITPELLNNPAIYPPPEVRANLYFNAVLTPDAEQAYNDAWDEIKIMLGQ